MYELAHTYQNNNGVVGPQLEPGVCRGLLNLSYSTELQRCLQSYIQCIYVVVVVRMTPN